jgi:hypothetical protein
MHSSESWWCSRERPRCGAAYRYIVASVYSFTGCGSCFMPCSMYARQIGAVPSGRSVSERPLRSSNVYISFWTMSEPAPEVRANSSVSSKTGVWMRR